MVLTTKLYPADDLWDMPGHEPWEIWDGELRKAPGAGDRATRTALAIGSDLLAYERQFGIGMATGSDGSFILSTDPDTVVVPDAAFVRWERLPDRHDRATYIRASPDLAVEVQSPTDEPKAMVEKRELYTRAGVALQWWVDPEKRTVTAYRLGHEPVVLTEEDTLDGGDVRPGLRIPIAQIFPTWR